MLSSLVFQILLLDVILLTTPLLPANGQGVVSYDELRKQIASRRLNFGDSTIQTGECVAVPTRQTLPLTVEVIETRIAKYTACAVDMLMQSFCIQSIY